MYKPPQIATNLWASWTTGVILNTYLKYKIAKYDQYTIGRVVLSLWPVCSAKFAILPPLLDYCYVVTSDVLVKSFFLGILSQLYFCYKIFDASYLFHLETLQTIILSSFFDNFFCNFITYAQSSFERGYPHCMYVKEDSIKFDMLHGDQGQWNER